MQNNGEKIDKIKNLTEKWSLRKLTLFGKITVIKAYLALPLHDQTCPNTIKEINDILFKFLCLWEKKVTKLSVQL